MVQAEFLNNKAVTMPAYESVCRDCNHEFESDPKIKCPHCQSDNVLKKISEFTTITSKKL